jgi:hypothetical protein
MSALSIRHMNIAIVAKEQLMEEQMKSLPTIKDTIHYWHIERKSKRGKKWIYTGQYFCTKEEMARIWVKFFRDGNHRLRHMMKY